MKPTKMLILLTFLVVILLKADAQDPDNDPPEITFQISSTKTNHLICDNNFTIDMILQHTYTVREGETFKLITKYTSYIYQLTCSNYNDNSLYKHLYIHSNLNGTIKHFNFKGEKRMGDLWNCTILAHRDNPTLRSVVHYKNANYSAASCFMKIHVRQTKSPQTILVNNMVLEANRTGLSVKDVDFIAEYQYADGDEVDVTCANYLNQRQLKMAGTIRDISTMKELSAQNAIGFRVKLGSGHSNSYIICTDTEPTDYTKVMVRFVMRTEFNSISIKINGMTLRPKLTNELKNHYVIEYKYQSYELITVVCEIQTDLMLVVTDSIDFAGKVSSYRKTEIIRNKKAEMTFHLGSADDKTIYFAADTRRGLIAEQVDIHFTAGNFPIDNYPLRMELPSNGTVMELYSDYKSKVFLYEFEDGETVQLKCGPLSLSIPGPAQYLQLNDSDKCKTNDCVLSKTLHLTRKNENTKIVCYLKQQISTIEDEVLREIRVILRERVVTTTSTTSTTTTSTTARPIEAPKPTPATVPTSQSSVTFSLGYAMAALSGAVFVIFLILLYCAAKKIYSKICSSQEIAAVSASEPTPSPHPATMFYENLLAVFQPINEREAEELETQNHYEEIL